MAAAAQDVGTAPKLDAVTRRAIVQRIEEGIDANYVFPELKPALRSRLEQSLRNGRYDVSEPGLFASRVTDDLEAVSHDGHLYLNYDPEQYAAALAPPGSDAGLDAYRMRAAVRTNSGLIKQEILPGNLRYLRVESFRWVPDLSASAYDAAFRFLGDGDAIILDLRENGGGKSDAADRLMDLVTPLAKHKPVYVLVDGHVASAAEAVSYGLQQSKLATIVGATTYGAANNNKKLPIAPQFILSVSYNRPINPVTGTNWEGVGVVPDIKVRASAALVAAELAAYRQLRNMPATTAEKAAEYDWAVVSAEAQLHPVGISLDHLRKLTGNYGTISIQLENGALFLNRSDRPKWDKNLRLTPLRSDDTFLVEGADDLRLRFTRDGLDLLHGSEEAREPFARTSPRSE